MSDYILDGDHVVDPLTGLSIKLTNDSNDSVARYVAQWARKVAAAEAAGFRRGVEASAKVCDATADDNAIDFLDVIVADVLAGRIRALLPKDTP